MGSRISFGRIMNGFELDNQGEREWNSTDISRALQYFLRSGQLRIVSPDSSYQDNSEDDDDLFSLASITNPVTVDSNPDTSKIKDSDICQNIMLNSGALNDKSPPSSKPSTKSLTSMLTSREVGMNGRQQFSRGDRCQINQRYLPNKMKPLDSHQCKVFCGAFARDGDIFMSASQDYLIRVYDSSTSQFKLLKRVEARDVGWSILDTAVSPDGCHFVYCSWSESIHICNVFGDYETHEALALCPDERRFCVFALRFSQDGREILGGANDECLYVYNRGLRQRTLRIHAHEDDVNTVAFADSTSQILFSGGDDGLCKVWDRRALSETMPKPVGILSGHEDGITYVDAKGDGRHLITNSKDQTIKLWDMRKFSPSNSVDESRKAVQSHNWDYRWQRVPLSLCKHKKKLPGDTSLMTYRGHSVLQTLIRCHFSPEATTGQQYIYTGCAQGRVVIYDVLTGKIKAALRGHQTCVRDVSWHPYRNEIISSSWDGVVAKWTYFVKSESDSDDDDESDCDCEQQERRKTPPRVGLRRSERLANQRRSTSERS